MKVEGKTTMSASAFLKRINRKFGLIHFSPSKGSCRVRIFGESDDTAIRITDAAWEELEVLAAGADFVKRRGYDV